MHKLRNTLSLCGLALLAIASSAQAARHYSENNMPSIFTESNGPSFSGFYGNVGLAYNMMSGSAEYAGVVQGEETSQIIPDTTITQGAGLPTGLVKFGYAFRLNPQFYLGLAGFYNLASMSTLASTSIPYSTGNASVNVKQTVGSSYGFLLQPGYILKDNKSAVYLNLGMEFVPVTVESSVSLAGSEIGSTSLSSTKVASNIKMGVGYQRQMTFLKFKDSHNLTWFVEGNYLPTTSVDFSQAETGLAPTRTEAIRAKVSDTQLVLGINYYF